MALLRKLAVTLLKVLVFLAWVCLSGVQVILREVVAGMRDFLFPNKK